MSTKTPEIDKCRADRAERTKLRNRRAALHCGLKVDQGEKFFAKPDLTEQGARWKREDLL
jgi:hypothetical protein